MLAQQTDFAAYKWSLMLENWCVKCSNSLFVSNIKMALWYDHGVNLFVQMSSMLNKLYSVFDAILRGKDVFKASLFSKPMQLIELDCQLPRLS